MTTPYKYVGKLVAGNLTWEVQGPDGRVAELQGNLARERAQDLATILNRAFELGVSKALQDAANGG